MQTQVKEWGNSQGVRLPKEVLKNAGIALNDILDVTVSNSCITLTKPFRHKTLEERAAEIVSKDFFNTSGEIIGCPIINHSNPGPLHIWMISEIMNISDAIQGIFEYI